MTAAIPEDQLGAAPAAVKRKPTLYKIASCYASQSALLFHPLAERLCSYVLDAYAWAKKGGSWRLIFLATAASLLACMLGGLLSLLVVMATVGASLFFLTALTALGAIATFVLAACSLSAFVFVGTFLAATAVIGVLVAAAVCCVLITSAWALCTWAFITVCRLTWKAARDVMQRKKKLALENQQPLRPGTTELPMKSLSLPASRPEVAFESVDSSS